MSRADKRNKAHRRAPKASNSSRFAPVGIEWATIYARRQPPRTRVRLVLALVRIILENLAREPSIQSKDLLAIRKALNPQILAQVETELLEDLLAIQASSPIR